MSKEWQRIKKLIEKLASKPGLRGPTDANCIACTYDPVIPGNWRQQVEACTSTACPMHRVRLKDRRV